VDWRAVPVQQYASYALGLPDVEIKGKVDESVASAHIPDYKYVCISEWATEQIKHWHYPDGWQTIVNYLITRGYKVVSVAHEGTNLRHIVSASGNSIEVIMGLLKGCEFYIGVASGLAWLAWALNKKVIMISGFSEPWCEFKEGNHRIAGQGECVGCYNDLRIPHGDTRPCPNNYMCSRLITPGLVIEQIQKIVA
jgi:autotransporter strand-loop-strand O-heptosyltransferase